MRLGALLRAALYVWVFAVVTFNSCDQVSAFDTHRETAASLDPEKTYVLAISCCVPWKGPHTCRETIDIFVSAAVTRLGIPRKNILTLLGSQATYEGVAKAFDRLSQELSPDSAVIIYYNGHGILLPEGSGSGHPEYVFVLWSEEFPFAGLYAVLAHVWMNDLEFSKRVKKLPGKTKLVIVDTCHAVGIGQDLLPKGMKIDYGLEDAALMAAAEAGQFAISTRTMPFSR
jgi:hypothetical protein